MHKISNRTTQPYFSNTLNLASICSILKTNTSIKKCKLS